MDMCFFAHVSTNIKQVCIPAHLLYKPSKQGAWNRSLTFELIRHWKR